jgi:peptidoglycan/xylan/chitin deacetylase (PgdA/CDA1 family)
MGWCVRDYGNRIGVFRIMEVLARYGIRATVALNSDICLEHPVIVREGLKLNWEFMGHTKTNAFRLNELPPGEEPKLIREVLRTISNATGEKVEGWLGAGLAETWDTLDILAAEGCSYVADWANDDQPYAMHLDCGRTLVSVPYGGEVNDKVALDHWYMTAGEFGDLIRRQFDTLWREGEQNGRVMAIALHPYITGVPHRIGFLDAALEYICNHEDVWFATGAEIARHHRSQIDSDR